MNSKSTLELVSSIIIALGLLAYAGWWFVQLELSPAVAIEAAYDVPENGLPVYAQYIVTQRVRLEKEIIATALEVPLYRFVEGQSPLSVTVRAGGQVIAEWQYQDVAPANAVIARFPFVMPTPLSGELEVSFAAPGVAVADRLAAPRVFVEPADTHYPDGNYRIAANEKQGDVGLSIIEQKSRGWRLLDRWRAKPVRAIQEAAVYVALFLLAAILPRTIFSVRSATK